jgi:hypothetical protein
MLKRHSSLKIVDIAGIAGMLPNSCSRSIMKFEETVRKDRKMRSIVEDVEKIICGQK